MYRRSTGTLQVFLVHPGGPFWSKKDSWTIPKGEYDDGPDTKDPEAPLVAAIREFLEETGFPAPAADTHAYISLGTVKQPSGKLVTAWAFEGDCDPALLVSNTCIIEWPPRSGRTITIPEADRGAWFSLEDARTRIFQGQQTLLDRLNQALSP